MHSVKNSCRGFTIIELMVGMIAVSIMLLIVGAMLVSAWRGWSRSNENLAMQRDASLALTTIGREVRNAAYDEITDGTGISFSDSGVSFSESGGAITRSDGLVLVDGLLSSGSFITRKLQAVDEVGEDRQWVEIKFNLQTRTDSRTYSIEVSPRN